MEFSDFQCPYCAAAVPQIDALLQAYPTQVKLIFKQYPLESHSHAAYAAAAALAAQKQGNSGRCTTPCSPTATTSLRKTFSRWPKSSASTPSASQSDLNSTEVRETLTRDVQDGDNAGVQGTPTLFINGQRYNGPIEVNTLKPILDAALKLAPAAGAQTASLPSHLQK